MKLSKLILTMHKLYLSKYSIFSDNYALYIYITCIHIAYFTLFFSIGKIMVLQLRYKVRYNKGSVADQHGKI
jgi:hypothetical protein